MRATLRHRRAVARELARFGTGVLHVVHIERGGTFDVHAARQHALGLIRYGRHHHRVRRRLELDSRGRARWATPVGDWAEANPGRPWPHLDWHDRQYARLGRRILAALAGQPAECSRCVPDDATLSDALGRVRAVAHGSDRIVLHMADATARRFQQAPLPHGDTTASEWWWLSGVAEDADVGFDTHLSCPDCKGSGHNLRGVLPSLNWPRGRGHAYDAVQTDISVGAAVDQMVAEFAAATGVPARLLRPDHRGLDQRDE